MRARRFAAVLPCVALWGTPAAADWELIPQVNAGIIHETNPRYSDEQEDDATGTFVDARVSASYITPRNQVSVTPRVRKRDYLESNKDLNDDDKLVDFVLTRRSSTVDLGLRASYSDVSVRTSEFEDATPEDPDLPPPITGGTGRFGDESQESWSASPLLSFQISPRNTMQVGANLGQTEYDTDTLFNNYFDYDYSNVRMTLGHALNPKNTFYLSINAGSFNADDPDSPYENTTDSFGATAAYERQISETLDGNVTVGFSRSSVDVDGLPFDTLTGTPCVPTLCSFRDEDRNFVGSFSLRRRSEIVTMNLDYSRELAPRSNGTENVVDRVAFYFNRPLTRQLIGTVGVVYTRDRAIAELLREDRDYYSIDTTLNWRFTRSWSMVGIYTFARNNRDFGPREAEDDNQKFVFSVQYRGLAVPRR